ncbi:MAG: restriction endonuclease subunit S [Methanocorpusculum sp.]|nr:restriction endonuclease subunit S [Methanocorpusculum sp.]
MSGALKRDEWKTVTWSSILEIKNGKDYKAVANENGAYPIYGSGGRMGYADSYICPEDTTIIGRKGSINKPIYVSEKFWNVDTAFGLVAKKEVLNPKFLYYFCVQYNFEKHNKTVTIPSLTKADLLTIKIPLPPLDIQRQIADTLDKVTELITLRKTQLEKLDELVKARFVEMFDGKGYPTLKWEEVFNTTTGKLDSNAMVENGEYPFFTCAKEVFRIDKYAFDQEALLLAGNNAAGKYDVKYYKGKFNAYQRTYVLGLKEEWSYQLFKYQLEDKLMYLQQQSLGGLTKYLTLKILGELDFIVPSMDNQNEFTRFVEQTDKSKSIIQQSLDTLETLKKSLMQEYFG